jgi:threonine aldolase
MKKAKRVRKKFGGGMRQAGYLAGAGIYALDHHIDRLQEDHDKALMLKRALENCAWVKEIDEVETNIVIFYLKEGLEDQIFLNHLEKHGIKAISMGQGKLRFVTHLDVSMGEMEEVGNILSHLPLSIG